MKRLATYLAFGLTLSSFAQTADTGSICGTVLDENGQPANEALVVANYLGAHSGILPAARSDTSGHYCILNVPYGDNTPVVEEPKRGYPNLSGSFYTSGTDNKEQPNIAHLSAKHPRATVDFRIPYKAAF